jgi:glycine cleavage system H protein
MAIYPTNLKYSKEHEWARREGNSVVVGVTHHAQDSLGEVVYVELPNVGTQVVSNQPMGVIESTKAVSELFSPVTGKVVKVNDVLKGAPQAINSDPYGQGWIVEIEPVDFKPLEQLFDSAAYEQFLARAAH